MAQDPGGIAVITGGSAGIGLALAHEFVSHNIGVLIVGRRKDVLANSLTELRARNQTALPFIDGLALDVSDAGSAARVVDHARERGQRVRYLVNNAAAWLEGPVASHDMALINALVRSNVVAPVHWTQTFLPMLRSAPSGRILNVGSLAGEMPYPNAALYGASKAFVHSWTRALRLELLDHRISVSLLAPGMVDTSFTDERDEGMARIFAGTAQSVAWAGFRGMMAGQEVIVPGLSGRLLYLGLRVMPRRVTSRMRGVFRVG